MELIVVRRVKTKELSLFLIIELHFHVQLGEIIHLTHIHIRLNLVGVISKCHLKMQSLL